MALLYLSRVRAVWKRVEMARSLVMHASGWTLPTLLLPGPQ
jgi:hypothetical protein